LTSLVPGQEANRYSFTSALSVSVLKLLAPFINPRLDEPPATLETELRWAAPAPAAPAVAPAVATGKMNKIPRSTQVTTAAPAVSDS
jgi:hypothetical protein